MQDGGAGNNTLDGGSGADIYVLAVGSSTGVSQIVTFEYLIDRVKLTREDGKPLVVTRLTRAEDSGLGGGSDGIPDAITHISSPGEAALMYDTKSNTWFLYVATGAPAQAGSVAWWKIKSVTGVPPPEQGPLEVGSIVAAASVAPGGCCTGSG